MYKWNLYQENKERGRRYMRSAYDMRHPYLRTHNQDLRTHNFKLEGGVMSEPYLQTPSRLHQRQPRTSEYFPGNGGNVTSQPANNNTPITITKSAEEQSGDQSDNHFYLTP